MKRSRTQRGSVLILTLWLAAGLAAAAVLAGHAAVLRHRRVANEQEGREAEHAQESALRYVQQMLTTVAEPGKMPDLKDYQAADLAIGPCRVWLLGGSSDPRASSEPAFALQDEAGRLNLNTVTLDMLEALPGMTVDLATAIVAWRAPTGDAASSGAADQTYLNQVPPYRAKHAPFETVDELRLLYGAEPLILNGVDRNRNTIVEAWEDQLAAQSKRRFAQVPDLGIMDLVTVSSREPNTAATGQSRVNLNGRTPLVRDALTELYGSRGPGMATAAGLGSTRFTSVLQFCLKSGITGADAETAFDRFTVDAGASRRGRVNVNTAPMAVLACLPGIGSAGASQLAAYRIQNPDGLTTPLWVAAAIGNEAANAAGPYITTKSYQFTADIVAVGSLGHAFRRTRYILDTTSGSPVVISARDCTHWGWPLGDKRFHELMATAGEDAP